MKEHFLKLANKKRQQNKVKDSSMVISIKKTDNDSRSGRSKPHKTYDLTCFFLQKIIKKFYEIICKLFSYLYLCKK